MFSVSGLKLETINHPDLVIKEDKIDFIDYLPMEIILKIFSFLNDQFMQPALLVNKNWHVIVLNCHFEKAISIKNLSLFIHIEKQLLGDEKSLSLCLEKKDSHHFYQKHKLCYENATHHLRKDSHIDLNGRFNTLIKIETYFQLKKRQLIDELSHLQGSQFECLLQQATLQNKISCLDFPLVKLVRLKKEISIVCQLSTVDQKAQALSQLILQLLEIGDFNQAIDTYGILSSDEILDGYQESLVQILNHVKENHHLPQAIHLLQKSSGTVRVIEGLIAIHCYDQAFTLILALKDEQAKETLLNNFFSTCMGTQDFAQMERYFHLVPEADVNDHLINMRIRHYVKGDQMDKAYAFACSIQDVSIKSLAFYTIATLFVKQERFEKALEIIDLISCLHHKMQTLAILSRQLAACGYLDEALNLVDQLDKQIDKNETLKKIADGLIDQDKVDDAAFVLRKTSKHAQKHYLKNAAQALLIKQGIANAIALIQTVERKSSQRKLLKGLLSCLDERHQKEIEIIRQLLQKRGIKKILDKIFYN